MILGEHHAAVADAVGNDKREAGVYESAREHTKCDK